MMINFCSAGYIKQKEHGTHTSASTWAHAHNKHAYKHVTVLTLKGAAPHPPLMYLSFSV